MELELGKYRYFQGISHLTLNQSREGVKNISQANNSTPNCCYSDIICAMFKKCKDCAGYSQ